MIGKIDMLTTVLKRLNSVVDSNIVMSKEIDGVSECIRDLKFDLQKFKKLIEDAEDMKSSSDAKVVVAHLYRYFGDILQDVENIHEVITIIAQRYGQMLEKQSEEVK